jgi:pSer/pThr/pTyr-binding forkhead associated (FHA) protein
VSFQNFQLVVRRGPQEGQIFPLTGETMTLGRDPLSDIAIVDPEVSRQHARLTRSAAGGYSIQDLGSTNGTFVDGNRLGGEAVPLRSGQIVVVGSNVTLVFEMLPEQTATVIASRDELGFAEPVVAPVGDMAPMPEYVEPSATDKLQEEAAASDAGATIIDHSFDQPAYPVFTTPEPEFKPEPAPTPIQSFDDSWSTPSSEPVDKGMPVFEPSYSSAPPPPPPPPIGGEPAGGDNRNRILIAVVVVLLLCCCCSLVTGGWFYGDALLAMFGF